MMKRALIEAEQIAIRRVAERLPDIEQKQLLDDLVHAVAETVTPDGSRVMFDIQGYDRPLYRGQHSFGVQGELVDSDGSKLAFDLFADANGRLLELGVVRWGEADLMNPDWNSLMLY